MQKGTKGEKMPGSRKKKSRNAGRKYDKQRGWREGKDWGSSGR